MTDLLINFDSDEDKRKLLYVLRGLKGKQAIQIKKHREGRSGNQNRYLWGVVYRYFGSEVGYTTEEAHDVLREMFLFHEKQGLDGQPRRFLKSTTKLDTGEMTEYIEKIRQFCLNDLGLYIPEPGEINY